MLDTSGKLDSLVEDVHLLNLANIQSEYDTHMAHLSQIFILYVNAETTTEETMESIQVRAKGYNGYEW